MKVAEIIIETETNESDEGLFCSTCGGDILSADYLRRKHVQKQDTSKGDPDLSKARYNRITNMRRLSHQAYHPGCVNKWQEAVAGDVFKYPTDPRIRVQYKIDTVLRTPMRKLTKGERQ